MKKYFKDTSNLVSFALGAIISFIFFVFDKNTKVPLWSLLIIAFFFVITVWLLIKSRIELAEYSPDPRIQIIECSHDVCVCKSNNLLSHSSWVTFYHRSGEYEQIIAFGNVETITQRGLSQIRVFSANSLDENILEYINNEKANILVRPTLTTQSIQQISNII